MNIYISVAELYRFEIKWTIEILEWGTLNSLKDAESLVTIQEKRTSEGEAMLSSTQNGMGLTPREHFHCNGKGKANQHAPH